MSHPLQACKCKQPLILTLEETTLPVARKDYPRDGIVAGQKYRRTLYRGYYRGGSRYTWIFRSKTLYPHW